VTSAQQLVVVVVGARAFAAMAPNGEGATGSWRPLARVVCTSAGHLAYMAVGQYFEWDPLYTVYVSLKRAFGI